jgi:putative addiction module killer protein
MARRKWLEALLDRQARLRIETRLALLRSGNPSDYKAVGAAVLELRIDYGPGYRLYVAEAGPTLALLLFGGDKTTQTQDILTAQQY